MQGTKKGTMPMTGRPMSGVGPMQGQHDGRDDARQGAKEGMVMAIRQAEYDGKAGMSTE